MEVLIQSDKMSAAFREMVKIDCLIACFAGAKLGKTRLTEGLVSEASRVRQMTSSAFPPEVIDAVSKTWLSPRALRVAVQNGIISSERAVEHARNLINVAGLSTDDLVKSSMHTFKGINFSEIEARSKLASANLDLSNFELLITPEKGERGYDPEFDGCLLIRPNNASTLGPNAPYLCIDQEGRASLENFVHAVRVSSKSMKNGASRIANLKKMKGGITRGSKMLATDEKFVVEVPLNDTFSENGLDIGNADRTSASSPNSELLIDDSALDNKRAMSWLEQELEFSAGEERVSSNQLSVFAVFSENGVTIAYQYDSEFDESDVSFANAGAAMAAIEKDAERASGDVSNISDLFERNPIALYEILVSFELISHVIMTDVEIAVSFGYALESLKDDLKVKKAPFLIETEDKASSAYGGIARSSAIESRLTSLELSTALTKVSFGVEESLILATVGALFMTNVTHVSVVDLTMVYDLAIKTTTRKGGLDSSQLNILQYLSGVARRSNSLIVAETRDDFFADASDMGVTARDTLGANSRIAIHITPNDADASTRDVWIRIKGYEDFEDVEFSCGYVGLKDYPKSFIRHEKLLPQFLETF